MFNLFNRIKSFLDKLDETLEENDDSRADIYKSLSDKTIRNQDLAIDRFRQLENKASWLLASFLIIYNLEYLSLEQRNLSDIVVTTLIFTAIVASVPLVIVIFPKNVKISENYKDIVQKVTNGVSNTLDTDSYIIFERTSIRYTETVTHSWNKWSKSYRILINISALVLICHWFFLLGIVLN